MVKCIFCGVEEESFKGVHIIGNDGFVRFYCSSKCRKNALKLNRDKRKLKWTEAYRTVKDKAVEKADEVKEEVKEEKKLNKKAKVSKK